jgi:hypothetical protein
VKGANWLDNKVEKADKWLAGKGRNVWNKAKSIKDKIARHAKNMFKRGGDWGNRAEEFSKEWTKKFGQKAKQVGSKTVKTVKNVFKRGRDWGNRAEEFSKEWMKKFGQKAKQVGSDMVKGVKNGVQNVKNNLSKGVKNLQKNVKQSYNDFKKGAEILASKAKVIANKANIYAHVGGSLVKWVKPYLSTGKSIGETLKGMKVQLDRTVTQNLKKGWNKFKADLKCGLKCIGMTASELSKNAKQIVAAGLAKTAYYLTHPGQMPKDVVNKFKSIKNNLDKGVADHGYYLQPLDTRFPANKCHRNTR